MTDFLTNFSCSDPDVSHDFITEEAWRVKVEGDLHVSSIKTVVFFLIIYMLVGIPWNGIILLVILKKQYFKDPTYMLLMNMVIADFIVCVICLPLSAASALQMRFNFGNSDYARCRVCHTTIILTMILTNYSLFVLSLLSTDRLIYIKWPLQYLTIVTKKKVAIMLTISILVSTISTIPPVFGFGEINFANPLGLCSPFILGRNRVTKNVYFILFQLLILAFPVSIALVANIWLMTITCKTAWRNYNKQRECTLSDSSRDTADRQTSEQELKSKFKKTQVCLAQVFSVIFFISFLTWTPTVFIILVLVIRMKDNLPTPWLAFVYLIFLSQPVIHPILETCLVGRARWMFFKLLHCINIYKKKTVPSASSEARITRFAASLELL